MMRTRIGITTLIILAAAGAFLWRQPQSTVSAQITNPQPAPAATDLQSATLIFGSKDNEPTAWDGSVRISSGRIEKIAGYHVTRQATIDGNSWKISTVAWAPFSGGMHPNEKPQPRGTNVEPTGVTIYFRAPADAELTVTVPKGNFSFRPMDLPEHEGLFPLNATVEIYRTPIVEAVTSGGTEDDYPSIAVDGPRIWVAWQGYRDQADRIFLRKMENNTWGDAMEVTTQAGDLYNTAVAANGGNVTVVWSERSGVNWQLKARDYTGGRFGAVETITSGEGNNLFHRIAADPKGGIHVAYQSARKGRSDIFLRSRIGGKWTNEVNLSDPKRDLRANDWFPSIAVDRDGVAWVAWDSYASGSYNVMMRSVRAGRAGELLKVTDSSRFHAHSSVAIDGRGRVWVAWDEAPENWAKDVGFLLSGGSGIYESRTIKVATYANGRWMTPLRQPGDVVPYAYKRYFQTPRLAADSFGRIWLFARPRTSARLPTTLWAAGGKWEIVATYYSADRWSDLILVPDSVGRNEGELQVAADTQGRVYLAAVTDHRLWGGPNFGESPQNSDILFSRFEARTRAMPDLGVRPAEPPGGLPTEPREKEQIARLRGYRIQSGGKNYGIYRGDWHRHTDISMDGAGDGSLWDSYRYAMDSAGMDWLAVTDHQSGTNEYTWWRIQKSADMFNAQPFFTGAYGVERSLGYPNGHRNLMFATRNVPILPITPAEQKSSTGPILYPFLRKYNGVAASHTSATNMGTDWRDNDPALEPLVEIFQGARTSAEHEGAPLAPTEKRTELHAGGYRPLGFVWKAWAKGYKLGVQSSSDHVSTHTSYSLFLAENSSREALIQAVRERHSYAATSNILMDFRMTQGGKNFIQGDITGRGEAPEITAKIHGTGPIKKVVIVRDNTYIYSQEPQGETFDLRYRETQDLPGGEHYYYVRMEQQDGNVAWSSPIWIRK